MKTATAVPKDRDYIWFSPMRSNTQKDGEPVLNIRSWFRLSDYF